MSHQRVLSNKRQKALQCFPGVCSLLQLCGYLLLNTDEPEQEPEVVYLWDDRIGAVANGINYFEKEEGEEPS